MYPISMLTLRTKKYHIQGRIADTRTSIEMEATFAYNKIYVHCITRNFIIANIEVLYYSYVRYTFGTVHIGKRI